MFYDAACGHCRRLAGLVEGTLARRGIATRPLQAEGVPALVGVAPERVADELRMLRADGTVVSGADAVVAVAREVPWAWGLALAARLPGAMPVLRHAYRTVAARRGCG